MTLALECSPPSASSGAGEPSPYPRDKGDDLLRLARAAVIKYRGSEDEDIAQTVALQSLKAFSALVYRVAKNRCTDDLRHHSRVVSRTMGIETEDGPREDILKRIPEPRGDAPKIHGKNKLAYTPKQRKAIAELRHHFVNARKAAQWLQDHPAESNKLFGKRIPKHVTIFRVWKEWDGE